mmetsp:Transcript_104659/g.223712  ORF Transcript_104659/g.223712 Transcript_104659/m.223712 type:complete len:213 (+) Transcript_104659:69-707(+)
MCRLCRAHASANSRSGGWYRSRPLTFLLGWYSLSLPLIGSYSPSLESSYSCWILSSAPIARNAFAAFFFFRSSAIFKGVAKSLSGPLSTLISALSSRSFLMISGLFAMTPSCTGVLPPKAGNSRFALNCFKTSNDFGWLLITAAWMGAAPLLLRVFKSAFASSKARIPPTSPLPQALCNGVYPLLLARVISAPLARRKFTAFSATSGAPAAR